MTDFDARLRQEAMDWLAARTRDGLEPVSAADLLDFTFDGEPFRLMDAQRGIRKPRQLTSALSIRTVYSADPARRPYADDVGADGLLRYKWRGNDDQHAENRALRQASADDVALIWFIGVGDALYRPVFPVYLLWEEPERQQFVVDVGGVAREWGIDRSSVVEENLRRYITRERRVRLHQPVFRASVLRAYKQRCSVCSLRYAELLDAAHIVPDRDDDGIPAVRNGLALCKIHHAAYDSQIMGIRPDLRVEIRADVRSASDGPMLLHGLQGRHDQPLMVLPSNRRERPDPEFLARRYAMFQAA